MIGDADIRLESNQQCYEAKYTCYCGNSNNLSISRHSAFSTTLCQLAKKSIFCAPHVR